MLNRTLRCGALTAFLAINCGAQNTFPASGNVGVGTTSPQNQLSVQNGVNIDQGNGNTGALNNGATSGSGLAFGAGSGEGIGSNRANGANMYGLDFYTSFAQRMSITNGGNVGIRNTNPVGPLDIAGVGGLIVSGANLDPSHTDAAAPLSAVRNSGRMLLGWNRSGYGGDIDLVAGGGGSGMGGFRFYDYTDAGALNLLMAMPGNGNVGIGTPNPQYKLSVNGTIQAKEVLINTGWADYVFQPNYRVKPLAEVAAFIKANHHLPNIPSESEVKENGVSLGDMQSRLLAKIEELTLQMIQLDQNNRTLAKRAAKLQAAKVVRSGRNGGR